MFDTWTNLPPLAAVEEEAGGSGCEWVAGWGVGMLEVLLVGLGVAVFVVTLLALLSMLYSIHLLCWYNRILDVVVVGLGEAVSVFVLVLLALLVQQYKY